MKGIYRIINKINNKIYIGSSVNLKNREQKHFKNLKDGKDNFIFEVIEFYKDEYELFLSNR